MRGAAIILDVLLLVSGLAAFAMALYLFVVTVAGFFAKLITQNVPSSTRIALIIPAHNESLLIKRTIESIQASDYPAHLFDIFVIADNCTDDTAEIAVGMGVRCLERFDEDKRGKGHALRWAFDKAVSEKWDYGAYIIIDADSVVSAVLVKRVNDYISSGFDALSCFHMVQGSSNSPAIDIVKMGFTLRNLRNAGISVLGGSAPLLGSGMCFSGRLVQRYGWSAFSLTEDREEWAFLYSKGVKVGYIPDAKVYSEMPGAVKDLENPMARWDVGRMNITTRFLLPFLSRLRSEKSPGALLTLLELITPPFTLILFSIGLGMVIALVLHNLISQYTVALWVVALSLMSVSALLGLIRMKAPLRNYLNLFIFSVFLVPWRVLNFTKGAFGKREWRRTAREESTDKEAE